MMDIRASTQRENKEWINNMNISELIELLHDVVHEIEDRVMEIVE